MSSAWGNAWGFSWGDSWGTYRRLKRRPTGLFLFGQLGNRTPH